jgi:hypothetical protein
MPENVSLWAPEPSCTLLLSWFGFVLLTDLYLLRDAGKSVPFGDASLQPENAVYLTTEQVWYCPKLVNVECM